MRVIILVLASIFFSISAHAEDCVSEKGWKACTVKFGKEYKISSVGGGDNIYGNCVPLPPMNNYTSEFSCRTSGAINKFIFTHSRDGKNWSLTSAESE